MAILTPHLYSFSVRSSVLMLNNFPVSLWIKLSIIQLVILSGSCLLQRVSKQSQQSHLFDQPGQPRASYRGHHNGQNLLHDKVRIQDREHIKEHLGQIINEPDLSKMSDEEAQFYYFKSHDSDHNNKLDGSELINSIIHWYAEEYKHQNGQNAAQGGTTKIFTDIELANMIDPILHNDDLNKDGYIDYPEFVAAQDRQSSTV